MQRGRSPHAAPSGGVQDAGSAPVKLTLEQWSTRLAPLSDGDRASISALSDFLDGQQKAARPRKASLRGPPVAPTPLAARELDGEPHVSAPDAARAHHAPIAAEPGPSRRQTALQPKQALATADEYGDWIKALEKHLITTDESSYTASVQRVARAREAIDSILEDVERAAVHVSELRAGCQYVEEGTTGLRDDAESHLERMDRLLELADGLALRRSYFALLPSITRFLSSPSPDLSLVLAPEFLHNLDKLDVALAFVVAHEHYRDASLYRMRFEQCVVRAASLIRLWINRWAGEWTTKTQEGLKTWQENKLRKGKEKERSDDAELGHPRMEFSESAIQSLFFDPHINEAPQIRMLLFELEKRTQRPAPIPEGPNKSEDDMESVLSAVSLPEIGPILSDCRSALLKSRQALLSGFVNASLARMDVAEVTTSSASHAVQLVERALRFLVPLAADEEELISQMFDVRPPPEGPPDAHRELIAHLQLLLATPLLDKLRPRLATEHQVAALADASRLLTRPDLAVSQSGQSLDTGILRQAFAPTRNLLRTATTERALALLRGKIDVGSFDPLKTVGSRSSDDAGKSLAPSKPSHQRATSSIGGAGLLSTAIDADSSGTSRPFSLPSADVRSQWHPTFVQTYDILATVSDILSPGQLRQVGIAGVEASLAAFLAQKPTEGTGGKVLPLWLMRNILLLREVLVSLDVAIDRLRLDGTISDESGVDATGPPQRTLDLGGLASALGALWSNTGALLDPRRVDRTPAASDGGAVSEGPIAKRLEAVLQKTSEDLRDLVVGEATQPLKEFTSSQADEAAARRALESFKDSARATLDDVREAAGLWLGDEHASGGLLRSFVEAIQASYDAFKAATVHFASLTGVASNVEDAVGWHLDDAATD